MSTVEAPKRTEQLISLPRSGYELWYCVYPERDRHEYRKVNDKGRPGVQWPGCSGIGKALDMNPDPLLYWAEKLTAQGVATLCAGQIEIPDDGWQVLQLLKRHELRWDQQRQQMAERGKTVHRDTLEALAKGLDVPDLGDLPPEYRGYAQGVMRFFNDRIPDPDHVEQVVLSLEHGYAGRSDLIGSLLRTPKGAETLRGPGIIDLKTGNGIRDRNKGTCTMPISDHVQIRGYKIGAVECELIEQVNWLLLLQVTPQGTYREHIAVAEDEDFFLALQAYQANKRIQKAMVPLQTREAV